MEENRNYGWIAVLIVVVALAAAAYLFYSRKGEKPPEAKLFEVPKKEEAIPEPKPELEEPAPAEPAPAPAEPERELPPLDESDGPVLKDLRSLAPGDALSRWLVSDEVIRKWVAAVNTASQGQLIHKHRPFKNIRGSIAVSEEGATGMVLSEENYHRYDVPVRLFAQMDTDTAVKLYRFWYPRLAQAYGELGIRNKTFHQVLLQAIDRVLEAPQVEQPIQLVRPSVYYKFADPKLEKLPGLHKLMIRIGPDHAERVKEKLRELKSELQSLQMD
ncbi:DUF3014 domain-containing protein [Microbulbifer rhizosphaerae]|uniref:DUF3014 domain-containing protein n=1 Tax=Microbulbifer rhizosphaerae TaxID=1562603 RepID=A0A7W4WF51_9GAMM|nr:DUF3014 domain-containing protein [Microbulbifer rhizosphaerae]MBB3062466.1 hypothetical protein [Microbulbifer rhizosphaerae]